MAHLKGILSYVDLSTNCICGCNWQLRTRSTLFIPTDLRSRSRQESTYTRP